MNKKFSHGVQFVGAYTWSHNIDDATAEVFSTVLAPRRAQNGLDLAADRGNSILDHRHRLTFSLVYDEPFFKNSGAFLRNTLGGWEVAPIYTYQSGQWVTTTSGVDSNLNLDSAGDRVIANPGGVKGTGSGTNPLCRSIVPGRLARIPISCALAIPRLMLRDARLASTCRQRRWLPGRESERTVHPGEPTALWRT